MQHILDLVGQFCRRCKTLMRLTRGGFGDDPIKRFGDRRHRRCSIGHARLTWLGDAIVHHPLHGLAIRVASKETTSHQHFPEHHTKRPDVGTSIERLPKELLRRHVGELAFDLARLGLLKSIACLRDTEVEHLGDAVVEHEEVLRRDVAMDDAERFAVVIAKLMRRVKTAAGLGHDATGELPRKPSALACTTNDGRDRLAMQVLHHEVASVVVFAEVDDAADIWMLHTRGDARLIEEHADEARILSQMRMHDLDGDPALKALRSIELREIDRSHAALRDEVAKSAATEHPIFRRQRDVRRLGCALLRIKLVVVITTRSAR